MESENTLINRKKAINTLLQKGYLVSSDWPAESFDNPLALSLLAEKAIPELLYVNQDIYSLLQHSQEEKHHWEEIENAKVLSEKYAKEEMYRRLLHFASDDEPSESKEVQVLSSYEEEATKREVNDFTQYFTARFEMLRKILYSREDLKNALPITRILAKRERENVSIIGIVKDKAVTKNGNIMLTLEDNTGEIKVLVSKNKPEQFSASKDIVFDEVLGVSGVNGENIIFANTIIWPDIPLSNELKKTTEEAYALCLSDLHIGSVDFLADDFNRFLDWINQKTGSDKQKEIAAKVKYIFIVGDLIDGVGIYPGQEKELSIADAYEQYAECARLLSHIPQHISLIICPGNHDALRLAEPQPPFYKDICPELYALPNATIVSNPSLVRIHKSDTFPGYSVLLYHGYSFDHYVANVDSIRNNGGYDRADLIMKFLLKRRHLAPTHTSTLYVPYKDKDPLVIDTIPDFFLSGHIHKVAVSNYRNITLICASCWQKTTPFQEKVGHHPEPSRVPLINLATREVKILRFGK